MNKAARKELAEIVSLINSIDLEDIAQRLTDAQAEEQDKFDNLTEGLQAADRGQRLEAAADELQNAMDYLEEARAALDEALSAIETAQE